MILSFTLRTRFSASDNLHRFLDHSIFCCTSTTTKYVLCDVIVVVVLEWFCSLCCLKFRAQHWPSKLNCNCAASHLAMPSFRWTKWSLSHRRALFVIKQVCGEWHITMNSQNNCGSKEMNKKRRNILERVIESEKYRKSRCENCGKRNKMTKTDRQKWAKYETANDGNQDENSSICQLRRSS